jgi:hypothetical protein
MKLTAIQNIETPMNWSLKYYAAAFIALFAPLSARAAHLDPTTTQAWDEFVQSANSEMQSRLQPGRTFLWADEEPDRAARVHGGEIVVSPLGEHSPMKVQSGLIHHWIGTVFVPNATLSDVLQVVRDYSRYKDLYTPGVIDSKAISMAEDKDLFSMQLMNRAFLLKTAFDADYESCYIRVDSRRLYSVSHTTRLQEIDQYGSPQQHMLQEGQGNGIIWRLYGITRYEERDGGVYVELEAMGLSRGIPVSLRWMVDPIVRRVSRSSLSTSLEQTAKAVHEHAETAHR